MSYRTVKFLIASYIHHDNQSFILSYANASECERYYIVIYASVCFNRKLPTSRLSVSACPDNS